MSATRFGEGDRLRTPATADQAPASRRPGARATGNPAPVKALAVVAGLLVLVIATGTVFGFATGARQRKLEREARMAAESALSTATAGKTAFTGIGRLRASTADAKPAVVVATIAFPYDASDRAFREELIRAAPALKAAAIAWLSRKKAEELAPAYEGAVKAALRDAMNGLLSLGKIEEIWFSDFSVIQ